ncbi:hypothetical protein IWX81_000517 [Salinibacterium sp. CAN_S4]|uniref:DUF2510 domain-containing protein n=1 Tax=Salinibacterium sp. CAN_S4 TaxID=2787727 RepID=UPI0018EF9797
MSIIQNTHVPAGWYPDGVAEGSLRWWDGTDWTHDVRPIAAPVLVPVPPMDVEYVPGESLPVEPAHREPDSIEVSHDLSSLLASVPERQTPVQLVTTSALSRRQLREMLGGPLVTEAPTDQ